MAQLKGLFWAQWGLAPAQVDGQGGVAVPRVNDELVGVAGPPPNQPVTKGGVAKHHGVVAALGENPRNLVHSANTKLIRGPKCTEFPISGPYPLV